MLKILHTKKEQLGGFKSLEIILLKDVINCPHILTNENAVLFTYKQFFEEDISILPVGETIYMNNTPKKTANGILHKLTAGFEVNYLDIDVDTVLEEYHLKKVIVKGNTFNNTSVIYGSVLSPLTFYYDVTHSKKIENPSKFAINCKANISQKPVIVKI
jgi:hypothetical protein